MQPATVRGRRAAGTTAGDLPHKLAERALGFYINPKEGLALRRFRAEVRTALLARLQWSHATPGVVGKAERRAHLSVVRNFGDATSTQEGSGGKRCFFMAEHRTVPWTPVWYRVPRVAQRISCTVALR